MVNNYRLVDSHDAHSSIVSLLRWQAHLSRHILLHIVNGIRKNKVNYGLGFFACFLVVFVVALVVSIIGNTPVVFLRLAELDVGEMDMVVQSARWSESASLNYTAVEKTELSYSSPRYRLTVNVASAKECPGLDPFDPYWKYHPTQPDELCGSVLNACFSTLCKAKNYHASVYLIDSQREARMELGREWDKSPLSIGYPIES